MGQAAGQAKRSAQHLCNGVHIFCRLRGAGFPKGVARCLALCCEKLTRPLLYHRRRQ